MNDNISKMETITNEQAEEVMKAVEENLSEDEKTLREIQKGNVPEHLKDTSNEPPLIASPDPETGEMVLNTESSENGDTWEDMVKELEDVKPAEFTASNVGHAITEMGYKDDVSVGELNQILQLIKNVEEGGTVKYKDMPPRFQSQINKTILELSEERNAPYLSNKELKDQMAKMFIDTVANEAMGSELKKAMIDINKIVKNTARKEFGTAVSNDRANQYSIMVEKLPELASRIKADHPEKAEQMIQVSEAYKESFTLQGLYNSYYKGKPKIKPIQVDKFNRTCGEFQRIYNNTTWEIQDISTLFPILCRNFPDADEKVIKRFIVLFINYVNMMKMTPVNLWHHTFMYYTIYNISSLDLYRGQKGLSESEEKFYKELTSNINKILDLIIERM